MDLETALAHCYFGIPDKKEVLSWVENKISSGSNNQELLDILIIDTDNFSSELQSIIERALKNKPTYYDLAILAAKHVARKIINNDLSALDGAKNISFYIENKLEENESNKLSIFSALVSEHEDFEGQSQLEFYGKKKCEELQKKTLESIREEAIELVNDRL